MTQPLATPEAAAPPSPPGQRAFAVLNPAAGGSSPTEVYAALERHLPAPHSLEVYETTGAASEDVAALVCAAVEGGCTLVLAAGGDGTVSEVAEQLIGTDVPLGIIPVGTANVFARELGLPLALDDACALCAGDYATTTVDAMKVGERHVVLQLGIGLDSLMIRDTERAAKRRFGRAAYLWTALRQLVGFQPERFTILADDQRIRPRASQVLIANGGVLGTPPFSWGPHIQPNDGTIDVCVVSARTLIDYLGLIWHTLLGQQRRNRHVRYLTATRMIAVSADHPLPVQADGEIIGETPVQIAVVPRALRVVVPPQAD